MTRPSSSITVGDNTHIVAPLSASLADEEASLHPTPVVSRLSGCLEVNSEPIPEHVEPPEQTNVIFGEGTMIALYSWWNLRWVFGIAMTVNKCYRRSNRAVPFINKLAKNRSGLHRWLVLLRHKAEVMDISVKTIAVDRRVKKASSVQTMCAPILRWRSSSGSMIPKATC